MNIVSRSAWGARKARNVDNTTWGHRTGFMVHYSGASASQSVRSIQDYHMDNKGWADIGYNFLVHSVTGTIYEGRGWLAIGAHCAGYNTANIGVCVIGTDKAGKTDNSDAARAAVKWLYAEAKRRKPGSLVLLGHRDRGSTDCPGDELYSWIRAGMPGGNIPQPAPHPDWEERARMALPNVKQGQTGGAVKKSQGLLAAAGYPPANSFKSDGQPDGEAGPGWHSAVTRFQSARRITADAVIGPVTWGELLK